jgi:hypothetical protein
MPPRLSAMLLKFLHSPPIYVTIIIGTIFGCSLHVIVSNITSLAQGGVGARARCKCPVEIGVSSSIVVDEGTFA